jgi:hypothetical protein
MASSYFADFDDDESLEFENGNQSFDFDHYLTVRGVLRAHYGKERGDDIYELLKRTAEKTADSISDVETAPGILFNDDGGEFVGFEKDAISGEGPEGF